MGSPELLQRPALADPIPEPVRIEVSDGQTLTIAWEDGSSTHMTARELRAFCQCAACRELPAAERTVDVHAEATIESAALVGGYAVSFVFGPDGHSAGIYPFVELKRYESS